MTQTRQLQVLLPQNFSRVETLDLLPRAVQVLDQLLGRVNDLLGVLGPVHDLLGRLARRLPGSPEFAKSGS